MISASGSNTIYLLPELIGSRHNISKSLDQIFSYAVNLPINIVFSCFYIIQNETLLCVEFPISCSHVPQSDVCVNY